MLEHELDLAAHTVHNALQNVTRSMAAYASRGSYPEGPAYWAYGTSYNVLLVASLESVLRTDFGLSRAPGFSETGQYPSLATGPSGHFFNYADGGSTRSFHPALFWFAKRYERPDWAVDDRRRLERMIRRENTTRPTASMGRFFPLSLLWLDRDARGAEIRGPLHWSSEGETPVTVHRSSWDDPAAVYVGVKAGSPSANHGQMDTGSFVLDADGVRWAVDLGAEGYHGIETRGMKLWDRSQGSDRWTIFRQQNHGHNTLVIDDQLQRARGKGIVVRFSDSTRLPHTIVDLSSVYEGRARSVKRGVALLTSNEVLIRDELSGLEPGSRVEWGMMTRGEPGARSDRQVELRHGDATLSLTLHSTDDRSSWKILDASRPRNAWDSPNPGTRRLAFHAVTPASGKLILRVLLRPGSCRSPAARKHESKSLDEWGR